MAKDSIIEFFGLGTRPFELVPNPAFFYLSKSHKKALSYLHYGLSEKAGFILVTGEVGSGKTTILRKLVREMDSNTVLSKVFNTKVSSEQLISMVNDDFGLEVKGKDKATMYKDLYDFLIEMFAKDKWPVLIIDEAQNLTPDLLEEVRMLSNLETDEAKLLQIILVGQPELRQIFSSPDLRQFRQRISINCHISHLTLQETQEYILHRLEVAGNRNAAVFSRESFEAIHAYSRGIPRLINIICDFVLLTAFAEGTNEISGEMAAEVIKDLEVENRYWGDSAGKPQDLPGDEAYAYPGAEGVLADLSVRICEIEKKLSSQDAQALQGQINKRLDGLERSVRELVQSSKASDGLKKEPQDPWETDKAAGPKKGFLHRIFG